jgi:hypothetical protein
MVTDRTGCWRRSEHLLRCLFWRGIERVHANLETEPAFPPTEYARPYVHDLGRTSNRFASTDSATDAGTAIVTTTAIAATGLHLGLHLGEQVLNLSLQDGRTKQHRLASSRLPNHPLRLTIHTIRRARLVRLARRACLVRRARLVRLALRRFVRLGGRLGAHRTEWAKAVAELDPGACLVQRPVVVDLRPSAAHLENDEWRRQPLCCPDLLVRP